MEKVLMINIDDILQYTTISGNIDEFKVYPHIQNAQILYIEPILGSDLYDKIIELVQNGDITGSTNTNYNTLLTDYITPSLIFHTMELFIPLNSYEISNGGTNRFAPTNTQISEIDEIEKVSNKYRIIGSKYDKKLSDYLCKNSSLFTEYINNDGLVSKTENTIRSGWYLGTSNMKNKIRE